MGAKNETYTNTQEDFLEKSVKKKMNLDDVYNIMKVSDLSQILSILLEPWNIIHLCCWYNNHPLLTEIVNDPKFDNKYLNIPDVNGEPPIAICCIVDAFECMKILLGKNVTKSFNNTNQIYRKDLNLNKMCVYHDAAKCFCLLNPDLTIESNDLDDCYDLSKKKRK